MLDTIHPIQQQMKIVNAGSELSKGRTSVISRSGTMLLNGTIIGSSKLTFYTEILYQIALP